MGGERTVVGDTPDPQQLEHILQTDMVGTIFIKLLVNFEFLLLHSPKL